MTKSLHAPTSSLAPLEGKFRATEVLPESLSCTASCPNCGSHFNKSVFSDGDEECCTSCGTQVWFELRAGEVLPHQVEQRPQGTSLSEALSALAEKKNPRGSSLAAPKQRPKER